MKELLNLIAEPSQITPEIALCLASILLVFACGIFIWLIYRQIKATETIIFNDEDDDASTDNN